MTRSTDGAARWKRLRKPGTVTELDVQASPRLRWKPCSSIDPGAQLSEACGQAEGNTQVECITRATRKRIWKKSSPTQIPEFSGQRAARLCTGSRLHCSELQGASSTSDGMRRGDDPALQPQLSGDVLLPTRTRIEAIRSIGFQPIPTGDDCRKRVSVVFSGQEFGEFDWSHENAEQKLARESAIAMVNDMSKTKICLGSIMIDDMHAKLDTYLCELAPCIGRDWAQAISAEMCLYTQPKRNVFIYLPGLCRALGQDEDAAAKICKRNDVQRSLAKFGNTVFLTALVLHEYPSLAPSSGESPHCRSSYYLDAAATRNARKAVWAVGAVMHRGKGWRKAYAAARSLLGPCVQNLEESLARQRVLDLLTELDLRFDDRPVSRYRCFLPNMLRWLGAPLSEIIRPCQRWRLPLECATDFCDPRAFFEVLQDRYPSFPSNADQQTTYQMTIWMEQPQSQATIAISPVQRPAAYDSSPTAASTPSPMSPTSAPPSMPVHAGGGDKTPSAFADSFSNSNSTSSSSSTVSSRCKAPFGAPSLVRASSATESPAVTRKRKGISEAPTQDTPKAPPGEVLVSDTEYISDSGDSSSSSSSSSSTSTTSSSTSTTSSSSSSSGMRGISGNERFLAILRRVQAREAQPAFRSLG